MKTPYEHAKGELGVTEIAGEIDNKTIVEYFAEVGHSWVKDDETAWCAAFIGAMIERSGYRSTRELNARSYLKWSRFRFFFVYSPYNHSRYNKS